MHDSYLSKGVDYYKPTMSQLAYEIHPDTDVTFTLKNRNKEPLSRYITSSELEGHFAAIRERGWQPEEIAYLASLQAQDGTARFTSDYLDHLADMTLPPLDISLSNETNDIAISTHGPWADVSFWETVIMSELNEIYYQNKLHAEGIDIADLYAEGDRRLDDKIARLQARPDIKISDFGTRRRFSADWHEHVLERLISECPENFSGTSNVWFAHKFGVAPIGTFAHELPMVYAALEDAAGHDPLDGHNKLLQDWHQRYGDDLSIALTDTFGSEFFFTDFTPEQAAKWRGMRHDSGDPVDFGKCVIEFYTDLGIDPQTKTIVFSDGLTIDAIEHLATTFKDQINVTFGWGTTLTNDLGLPANNFVMKATKANDEPTVKLSDVAGKHTGPEDKINSYKQRVAKHIGQPATQGLVTMSR